MSNDLCRNSDLFVEVDIHEEDDSMDKLDRKTIEILEKILKRLEHVGENIDWKELELCDANKINCFLN